MGAPNSYWDPSASPTADATTDPTALSSISELTAPPLVQRAWPQRGNPLPHDAPKPHLRRNLPKPRGPPLGPLPA